MMSDLWVGFVMRFTLLLPEITHVLKLRGWLIGFALKGIKPKNLQISKDVRLFNVRNMDFGNDVFISGGCWILANNYVKLEDEVMIGPMCILVTGDHTKKNGSYRFGSPKRGPIEIGYGSWIGGNCVITKGVTLGRSCCVAAGAAVGRSFPDGSTIGGIPAKIIKTTTE